MRKLTGFFVADLRVKALFCYRYTGCIGENIDAGYRMVGGPAMPQADIDERVIHMMGYGEKLTFFSTVEPVRIVGRQWPGRIDCPPPAT